jgi:hypothetical protein
VLTSTDDPPVTLYYCQTGNQLLMRGTVSTHTYVYQLSR